MLQKATVDAEMERRLDADLSAWPGRDGSRLFEGFK
jgi:hypothetical protein